MPKTAHFTPALFQFLAELGLNNDKAWFEANRERFEADVKGPMLRFITEFGPKLEKISPHFVADPRPNGGSMFRIYRDTRFSKDKTPYKTNTAAQFRHEAGKDVHAPVFYLHLDPGRVFMGGGVWHPDPESLQKIREAIAEDPKGWMKIQGKKAFKDALEVGGESLKRPPKGFDPEHPAIEEIKRKDYIVSATMTVKQACAPDFMDAYAKTCKAASEYVKFLTDALGLPF
ncbi:MAG: DUF2461 domain-containing protein [Myxococcales bacterium]|nr:DUF2461 domain-containing protein [Myxococcales bacterium]MCB9645953.1 DUF2461 domain-containing protein [Deltaproteobacteria bacterium]